MSDAQRIAELEAELASARALLAETQAELDSFGYSVSHDLRAPLRSLNGFSKLLSDEARELLTPDTTDYLNRIVGATRRLESLMEDILTLSRAGRAPMSVRELDLGALTREAFVSAMAEAGNRKVESDFAAASVIADPALIRLMLLHAVGNACKFTRRRADARVTLTVKDEAGTRIYMLADNGHGFDMNYVDRLFSPFQRLHAASEYEGNGIGLAIIRRVVRRHGGRVWVQSSPEDGTTLYFTLWETARPPAAEAA